MQSLPLCYALLFLLIHSVDACLRVAPTEPGIPAIPCKTCADKWVAVTQGIGSNAMDPPLTVRTNGCARRTFTCRGNKATINVFSAFRQLESVTDQGTGSAVLIVTCNGAGTAWEHCGEKVVRVECVTTPVVPSTAMPTSTVPSSTAPTAVDLPCQQCAANLISNTTMAVNSHPMDDDEILMEGGCSLRKFTCKGTMASIAVFGPRGEIENITDGEDGNVDGTATFTVACNGSGTAWETGGMEITRVECSAIPQCKQCKEELITETDAVLNPKKIEGGMIDNTGVCAMRTFTCMGTNATIALKSGGALLQPILDAKTGTANLTVTCNEAGTGWEDANRMVINEVECSAIPQCKQCKKELITETDAVINPKKIEGGMIDNTGVCAMRTFTCMGTNATIALKSGGAPLQPISDAKTGTANLTVTCNEAGTGWEDANRMVINEVECSAIPQCKQCKKELITETDAVINPKKIEGGMIDNTGVCAMRTFTCMGTNATIALKSGGALLQPILDAKTGTANLTVTCNEAGTGWEDANRMVINEVECSAIPQCKQCKKELITETDAVINPKKIEGGMIDNTGVCAMRTFTCMGTNATIALKSGGAPLQPISDAKTGTANLTVTCNEAGTGWEDANRMVINEVECSAIPQCKQCKKELITETDAVINPKKIEGGMIDNTGVCAMRTFTCMGTNATIALKSGGALLQPILDAKTGTANLTVTCNEAGTGWEDANRMVINEVECSAIPQCKQCKKELITETDAVINPKKIEGGMIDNTGVCAMRTFTCMGTNATIALKSGGAPLQPISDAKTGTANLTVTCNEAGTGWEDANRMVINEVECSAIPQCKQCKKELITETDAVINPKKIEGGMIDNTGVCAMRTFTCMGTNATIALKSGGALLQPILDAKTGTANLTVTCNEAGTGWEDANRMVINEVECSAIPQCKQCKKELITETDAVINPKKIEGGMIDNTGVCAMRTFTCMGTNATIALKSGGALLQPILDAKTGTANLTVTCNEAGTGWEDANRMVINEVECSAIPQCKQCKKELITETDAVINPKKIEGGMIDNTGVCAMRTFTCMGTNATIALKSGGAPLQPISDAKTGTANLTVTCNEAGTGWEDANRMVINEVECSAIPQCKQCKKELITETDAVINPKKIEGGMIDNTGVCAMRTFTCMGTNATIALKSGGAPLQPISDAKTGTANLTVTCNEAGTGWEDANRMVINEVECSAIPQCKQCKKELITETDAVINPKKIEGGMIDNTGVCAMRTFTCMGTNATIALKSGGAPLQPISDAKTGTANLTVTCNEAGTGWEDANRMVINEVECSAIPQCKQCKKELITETGAVINPKKIEGGDIDDKGVCAMRTFTCMGTNASIALKSGGAPLQPISDAKTGTANLTVTCNEAGTGWEDANRMVINEVECSAIPQCKQCKKELITETGAVINPKKIEGGDIDDKGVCAMRTFTCMGTNATIALKSGGAPLQPISDAKTGTASLTVTCNKAGTGWEDANRMVINEVECSAIPQCKQCKKELITETDAVINPKKIEGGMIDNTGICAMRTFTCMGTNATIALKSGGAPLQPISDTKTGTANLTVTCNKAGTGWEDANRMVINEVECSAIPQCKQCKKELITETDAVINPKKIEGGMIDNTGVCAMRTFTCMGTNATIALKSGGAPLQPISDTKTGTANLTVTCNKAGTGWEDANRMVINEVECSAIPQCKQCKKELITETDAVINPKKIEGGMIDNTGVCAMRTFTCMGTNATIALKSGGAPLQPISDTKTGTANLTVTCNKAGTGWEDANRMVINEVECSAIPQCKQCKKELITETDAVINPKKIEGGMIDNTGVCAMRTFTCMGTNATIALKSGGAPLQPISDAKTGTANLTVTCNEAGTGWEDAHRMLINEVECSAVPLCKQCEKGLTTVTKTVPNAKGMDDDEIMMDGECATRTFTCKGDMAEIAVTAAKGARTTVSDRGSGTATFTVTCNVDGKRWIFGGRRITNVECSTGPPCKRCQPNLIAMTRSEPNSQALEGGNVLTDRACARRIFMCRRPNAMIIVKVNGKRAYAYDAETGTAILKVTCNATGTGWESGPGRTITEAECSETPLCKRCEKNLITEIDTGPNVKKMDDDKIARDGVCSERTFTCMGDMAEIAATAANGARTTVSDGGSGTAKYTVTCNADGKGWMFEGSVITHVKCSTGPPCQKCDRNLIATKQSGMNAKLMDETLTDRECTRRKFTCSGNNATITATINGGRVQITDLGTGIVTETLTCNADGNGWGIHDHIYTEIECSATLHTCQTCTNNTIAMTRTGPNAKEMDKIEDKIIRGCTERTFTCRGTNAMIVSKLDDGGIHMRTAADPGSDTATLTVRCASVVNRWTNGGMAVAEVECRAEARDCKSCTANQLDVERVGRRVQPEDKIDMTGACHRRTVTCTGGRGTFEIFSGEMQIGTLGPHASNMLMMTLDCTVMGTWQWRGDVVTRVVCTDYGLGSE